MVQSALALTMSAFINIASLGFVAVLLLLNRFGVILIVLAQYLWLYTAVMRKRSELLITKIEIYRSINWGQLPYIIVGHVFMEGPARIDLYFYVLPLGLLLNQVAWLVFIDWKIHEKYCHYWRDFKWAVLPAVFIVRIGEGWGMMK